MGKLPDDAADGSGAAPSAIPEDRIGFDGKWDVGIGLWFEATLVKAKTGLLRLPYRSALTVGADYTFGLGNGLHVLGEHFLLEDSAKAFGRGRGTSISAASVSYPLSVLGALSGIIYHDWEHRRLYRFLRGYGVLPAEDLGRQGMLRHPPRGALRAER